MLLTVANVGRVLDAYSVERPERGVTELAADLGLTKSKTHALLTSMAEIGLLRRTEGGRYRIGWRSLELVRLLTQSTPFRPIAHSVATGIARRFGDVVHVATLDEGRVVYVDRVVGPRGLRIPVTTVGSSLPAHCSGVGKVLLAHLDPAKVDAILDRHGLPALTERTITDRDRFYAELHRVRRDGLGYDREEVQAGLACVAAPIFDADGRCVAAISLSAPVGRRPQLAAYEAAIRRGGQLVTEQLRFLDSRTPIDSVGVAPV